MNFEDFIKTQKIEVKEIKYQIKKTKEKEDAVIIYLDNSEKITISVDNFFKYSLNNLKGLDDKLYEILKNEESIFLAYKGALRKLSIKDHTIRQINDYLNKYELEDNEKKEIINKLVNYGLLDDEKYCVNRINYLNRDLYSLMQIKSKLIKEGISNDLINKYLIPDNDIEQEKVKQLVNKYVKTIKNKSVNATKQTLLSKLTTLGFTYDICRDVINSINICNDNEIILLKKEYEKAIKKYENKYKDYELKNHIYSYLLNKGFKSTNIKEVMEEQNG